MKSFFARLQMAAAVLAVFAITGCGAPEAEFQVNWIQINKQEVALDQTLDETRLRSIQEVLKAMFGTPDDPALPDGEAFAGFSLSKLKMAAGPVGTDENGRPHGLYRLHCAHCHGVTGDGVGPTASFLNPYPRDYRLGVFKFKSTLRGSRPRDEDLHQILQEGIPGTAMPSFLVLQQDEKEALIQYVKYLAIRGEVETRLIDFAANEVDERKPLIDVDNLTESQDALEEIKSRAQAIGDAWAKGNADLVKIADRPAEIGAAEVAVSTSRSALKSLRSQSNPDPNELASAQEAYKSAQTKYEEELSVSIEKGRKLFFGDGGCVQCHGDTALGDGVRDKYDQWGDLMNPTDPKSVRKLVALGSLKPRLIMPRNLRKGVYRGGRRPIDIYWRIHEGIPGTPMPAATVVEAGSGQKGLTTDDIWHLVDYVRSLPYDQLSLPPDIQPVNSRLRN